MRGGIVPGELSFRPRGVGVVEIEERLKRGWGTIPPGCPRSTRLSQSAIGPWDLPSNVIFAIFPSRNVKRGAIRKKTLTEQKPVTAVVVVRQSDPQRLYSPVAGSSLAVNALRFVYQVFLFSRLCFESQRVSNIPCNFLLLIDFHLWVASLFCLFYAYRVLAQSEHAIIYTQSWSVFSFFIICISYTGYCLLLVVLLVLPLLQHVACCR